METELVPQDPTRGSQEHRTSILKNYAKAWKRSSIRNIRNFAKGRRSRDNDADTDDEPENASPPGNRSMESDDGNCPDLHSEKEVTAELSKLRETNQTLEEQVDWMQWQVDHACWIGGFHVEDNKIEQEFITLMERITTWSRSPDFTSKDGISIQLQFPQHDYQRQLLCQVSPWCDSEAGFEKTINLNPRHKRYLLRGLVARVLCDKVFPPSGEDYWLDKETRSHLKGIEEKVGPRDPDLDSLLRFHDWRALTVNLLSQSQNQEQQTDSVQDIVDEIYQILGYKAQEAASSAGALFKIVEAAVGLSQTLRKQRPCWSIRLPKVVVHPDGRVDAANYNTEEMLDKYFDEASLRGQSSGDQPMGGYVHFFITPTLLKRGRGNGREFDEKERVYRKAKVRVIRGPSDKSTGHQSCGSGM